jgi:hypothetical protein
MKALLLTAAMSIGLAAGSAIAAVPPGHGGIHGIPVHHCWPTRWNHWCHRGPIGIIGHRGPPGLVIRHPIGAPVHTVPNHGFPNGIAPEQRAQH